MKRKQIIVGARGSLLSQAQTCQVIRRLKKKNPHYDFVFRKFATLGDRVKLWERSDTGIFVKELEDGLISGAIDLAVHSVKDLPSKIPAKLRVAAFTQREDPRDILITRRKNKGLLGLDGGAIVGTTSLRRKAQILRLRPDLKVNDLRGNLDTRIRKLESGHYDAIVVAAAGIKRLRIRNLNAGPIPVSLMLPPPGQGALGIEVRRTDSRIAGLAGKLDDRKTRICVECERAFLARTKAGCRMPVAAFSRIKESKLLLEALIISLDGRRAVRMSAQGKIGEGSSLGRKLAVRILNSGGNDILREIENGSS